ncbi:HET-domain-containing protein [Stipitochalara longipes BDJ]|nr:HET-domain-containing protein [Stipitochalara longipes BDJ]
MIHAFASLFIATATQTPVNMPPTSVSLKGSKRRGSLWSNRAKLEEKAYLSDYRTSCQAFSPLSSLSDSANSSTSFEEVATWLDECRSHPQCAVPSPTLLPKRVIDVGHRNDPMPFLFESDNFMAPYIALSHCWGQTPIVRTTKATLVRRKQGIDISLLPPVFRDAIIIARRLGVRYLWIDSLCIIQDDPLDWQTESARMSTIYQNSLLTISAGLSGRGGGCFIDTPWLGHQNSVEITPVWIQRFSNRDTVDSTESQDTFSEGIPSIEESSKTGHSEAKDMTGTSNSMTDSPELLCAEDSCGKSANLKHCFVSYLPSTSQVNFYTLTKKKLRKLSIGGRGTAPFLIPRATSGIFVRKYRPLTHDQFASDLVRALPPDDIASRAWVFQERLLSTRVVNYTSSEIVWECKTVIDCQCKRMKIYDEKLSYEAITYPREKSEGPSETLKLFFENQILTEDVSGKGLVLVWTNVVFHYSTLHLSNPNDRLPALSGLAKRFQFKGLLGDYVAGLWTEHLDRMLCWSPTVDHVPGNRQAGYIAPTWSWASLTNRVYFSNLWQERKGIIVNADSTIVGSIINAACTRAGADPTGAISDGYLILLSQVVESKLLIRPYDRFSKLRRRQRELPSELDSESSDSESSGSESSDSESLGLESSDSDASTNHYPGFGHPYEYLIVHEETDSRQFFLPDAISELDVLTKEHTVTLLLWTVRDGPWINNNKTAFSCFVLLPHPHQDGKYTRLGLLQYYEDNREEPAPVKEWFGDAPVREVVII